VIHPQGQDLQRILWRYSSEKPIQEYRLTTVTYWTSSVPFLATRCLKKLADDNQDQYPRADQVLRNYLYVDDLLSGTSAVKESIMVQQEISSLLQTAGFTLRKWAFNHSTFLDTIQKNCKKHNRKCSSTMKMELQHSDYDGIQEMMNFRSSAIFRRHIHSEYKT
jgi:hypothetical protein